MGGGPRIRIPLRGHESRASLPHLEQVNQSERQAFLFIPVIDIGRKSTLIGRRISPCTSAFFSDGASVVIPLQTRVPKACRALSCLISFMHSPVPLLILKPRAVANKSGDHSTILSSVSLRRSPAS